MKTSAIAFAAVVAPVAAATALVRSSTGVPDSGSPAV